MLFPLFWEARRCPLQRTRRHVVSRNQELAELVQSPLAAHVGLEVAQNAFLVVYLNFRQVILQIRLFQPRRALLDQRVDVRERLSSLCAQTLKDPLLALQLMPDVLRGDRLRERRVQIVEQHWKMGRGISKTTVLL